MSDKFLLVDSDVLPEIFIKILQAKKLMAEHKVTGWSGAAKAVGISRSTLYKYKDKIFEVENFSKNNVSIYVVLKDVLGALQSLLKLIASYNISVITISQTPPSDGTAAVSLDLKVSDSAVSMEMLLKEITSQDFVVSAKKIIK